MRAGKLMESIVIERGQAVVNDAGTPTFTWQQVASLRAEKVEQSTTEFIRNFGASDEEIVVFRIHPFEGRLTNADRITWRGAAFNIKQMSPFGRLGGLELRCVRLAE